jgi:hypothetical protein
MTYSKILSKQLLEVIQENLTTKLSQELGLGSPAGVLTIQRHMSVLITEKFCMHANHGTIIICHDQHLLHLTTINVGDDTFTAAT